MIGIRDVDTVAVREIGVEPKGWRLMSVKRRFRLLALATIALVFTGCGMFNLGRWKGIERAAADEQYYLVKDMFLTAGSAYHPKEAFDHNMNESINLFFIPKNEPNTYVAESIWYDPDGQEFRKIRTTYDLQRETKKGDERKSTGTTRVQTISTKDLYDHKPGLWKVALYLDHRLVRRLTFSVR
jgi:hypothetical protein